MPDLGLPEPSPPPRRAANSGASDGGCGPRLPVPPDVPGRPAGDRAEGAQSTRRTPILGHVRDPLRDASQRHHGVALGGPSWPTRCWGLIPPSVGCESVNTTTGTPVSVLTWIDMGDCECTPRGWTVLGLAGARNVSRARGHGLRRQRYTYPDRGYTTSYSALLDHLALVFAWFAAPLVAPLVAPPVVPLVMLNAISLVSAIRYPSSTGHPRPCRAPQTDSLTARRAT